MDEGRSEAWYPGEWGKSNDTWGRTLVYLIGSRILNSPENGAINLWLIFIGFLFYHMKNNCCLFTLSAESSGVSSRVGLLDPGPLSFPPVTVFVCLTTLGTGQTLTPMSCSPCNLCFQSLLLPHSSSPLQATPLNHWHLTCSARC